MLVSAAPALPAARAGLSDASAVIPAAVSTAISALVRGPKRAGEVVAATRSLVAVQVDDGRGPALICLTGHGAVRLPCAMVVADPIAPLPVGTPAIVGQTTLRLPGCQVTAARWWTTRPPIVADPALCAARAATAARPDLEPALMAAVDRLAVALHSAPAGLDDAVRGLVGLGPGLTPAGDDVLCGSLVALYATGSSAGARLAAAVRRTRPFDRTTAVSAGLLAHATNGLGVPQLAALLTALGSPAGDAGAVRAASRELRTVGHTSGTAFLLGALLALAPDESRRL